MQRSTRVALLQFLLCIFSTAQSAKLSYSDPTAPPFIVRLQRIRSDRSVCAIVRNDGFFHVESETSSHFEVSEGNLNNEELANLKGALNNSELARLSQDKIGSSLIVTEKDQLLVSILRSPLTQDLNFMDRDARRPFDSFINPLVHWLDDLQRHQHVSFDELAGRNNCMPPKKLTLKPRGEATQAKEASDSGISAAPSASIPQPPLHVPAQSQKSTFLMRWDFNHFAEGDVHDTCIIVYPTGTYHMEKSTQSYQDKVKVRAFDGIVPDGDLQELESLLQSPSLKASTHRNMADGRRFREGEITTLDIPREQHLQQLSFANVFGFSNTTTDQEERIISPLRKWLKINIETKNEQPSKAVPTRCIPRW